MTIQDKKDVITIAEIKNIITQLGNACFCDKNRVFLDLVLLREFSPDEIRAVTAILGCDQENHYSESYTDRRPTEPGTTILSVYDFDTCNCKAADLGLAMLAVIAIRNHVEVWVW